MPLYDYLCAECGTRFALLLGVVAESPDESCPQCGSAHPRRLISRFGRIRSEDEVIDSLADPSRFGDLENPAEMRSYMQHLSSEMGEDLGDDFDELLEEAGTGMNHRGTEVTEGEG